jgi:Arc/MetJ-type ribon-helix-helix transcriptional regulator
MATTVQVSDPVKDQLDELKDDGDHTSYDSVIRELLREYDHGE